MTAGLGVGARLGNYRIEAPIGAGGMATVYRARDERLGRQVALKILASALAGDQDFRLRFIRESKAAAAVDHPNIIPIYEADDIDGQLFIAMRFVRDGDVQSVLNKEGFIGPKRALAIITAIASALDAAHAAGLVHRDVKPGNMLLDASGGAEPHVYLTDFGITRLLQPDTGLTDPGMAVGTPSYMAPEVTQGRGADGRADQWGLACSAFAMLSGSPPFDRPDFAATMYAAIYEATPALTSRRPELPAAVDQVFEQALAKSPASRFATCAQFAAALGVALGVSQDAPPGQPRVDPVLTKPLDVPLKPTFRYLHEPFRAQDDAMTSLGHDRLKTDLENRIRHSRGGTFLITGFRGVGKTTLVMRALDQLIDDSPAADLILPVTLSVARSTTTERLLFAIVRRIFETLSDSGMLERLPPPTRHALLVAYMRTSLSFKETQADSRERSAGIDLGLGPGKLVKAVADIAAPKVTMSANRSQSLATEAAFLAYSETDVEYDLMRIVSLVDRRHGRPSGRASWRDRMRRRSFAEPPRLHLIIVLDEVDKLTIDDAGVTTVEELLTGIKNILTMPGAHFLVVAGPDLHDRAIRDAARGSGVYESVFGWRMYVPCLWEAPGALLEDIVSADVVSATRDELAVLIEYLRFKARGVTRRLLQEVNDFVVWDDGRPRLSIGGKDMERVSFYARMERILRGFMAGSGDSRPFPVAIDEDRWRLGSYYVLDWVLQSDGASFTASQLLRDGEEDAFDPLLRISRDSIDLLLDHLVRYEVLDVAREKANVRNTIIADVAESAEKRFKLSAATRDQLHRFAVRRETERAAGDMSLRREDLTVVPPRPGVVTGGYPAQAPSAPPPQAELVRPPSAAPAAPAASGASAASGAPAAPGAWAASPAPVSAAPPPSAPSYPPTGPAPVVPAAQARPVTEWLIGDGRYALGELITEGALSSLYKGRDQRIGRQVTAKVLGHGLAGDEIALARFRREGEILTRLNHPQVVHALSVLDGPKTYAIIMERLVGPTLEELIRKDGPMAPGEVATMGQILADGLVYLAGEAIARLDLKPENIIMANRGPVITDLGIAREMDRSTRFTNDPMMGTPEFMAPEIVRGFAASPQSDIYSLGLVMYYCLAGKTPWADITDLPALLGAIANEKIDLSGLLISADFREVLARATAREPGDRFSSAAELRDALRDTPEWHSVTSGVTDTAIQKVSPSFPPTVTAPRPAPPEADMAAAASGATDDDSAPVGEAGA